MSRRVLFINYEYPPLGGGGGHATAQIARRLAASGWDVSVMTSRFRGQPAFENRDGVKLHRIPTLRRHLEKSGVFELAVFLLVSLFYVVKLYFKARPDFVIAFFSIPCGPAALLLNFLFGTPYAVALRGADVPGFLPEQLKHFHKATNWLTRLVWRCASVLTANSFGLKELAASFDTFTEILVIPNGVGEDFFFERPARAGQSEDFKLLTVSRLSRQKKIERQIEMLSELKKMGAGHIKLDIVGDGPERPRLEALAREKGLFDGSIVFHGWCDREGLARYYREAAVFVLSSDYEGMPNVVLEAMASSLAVVATDAPGTVDLVASGRNGVIVPRHRMEEFATAIKRLAADPAQLGSMQHASHELAKSYTWDAVAAKYGKMAEEFAGPPAASGSFARNPS